MNGEKSKIRAGVASRQVFPKPGTTLHKIITDPEFRRVFNTRLKQGNRWIMLFYKLGVLPLLGFSRNVMLLTTKGRKSQKLKVTPIGYYRIDDKITLISGWGKTANWYRNMEAYPNNVFIQIGFRREHVTPGIIEEKREILKIIKHLISQDPKGAKTLLGWDP